MSYGRTKKRHPEKRNLGNRGAAVLGMAS